MKLIRYIKDQVKKLLRFLFEIGQLLGFDILPHHYYSEIPNLRELKKETYWKVPSSMIGVNGTDIAEQISFVERICTKNLSERLKKKDIFQYACTQNNESGFGHVESDFLYCFIYNLKPKRIIQVGCGVSTAVMLLANKESNFQSEIICIDPYPTNFLKSKSSKGEIKLIPEKVQKTDLSLLTSLTAGDLFFIDSTHTVKPGSDVNKIIFEVLPRLKKGIQIHLHDIYFPYDYKRDLLSEGLFFSNESTLLHAFLIDNNKFKIDVSLSMLHYSSPDKLKEFLPSYNPQLNDQGLRHLYKEGTHFPSSTYLSVI